MSKLAIHYQNVPDWAKRLPQTWAKLIDPPSENPFSVAKVIGRTYMPDGEANALVMLAEAGAEIWFAKFRPIYERARYVIAWEGPNEPPVGTAEQRAALVRFTRRWMQLMHAAGHKVVVLNLSVGWPAVGQAADLIGALEEADYVGLHEYSAPTMQAEESWYCLRYRRTVAEWQAAGVRSIPKIIIGETGIDGGVISRHRTGWKSYTTEAGYIEQLAWYANELARDAYVSAAFVFTAGPSGWADFEVTETLTQSILNLVAAEPGPTPEPTPVVVEPTEESIRNVAWNSLYPTGGVPYAPQYALPKAAAKLKLAQPLTREVRFSGTGRASEAGEYVLQGFDGMPGLILWCKFGEWDKVRALGWQ